MLDRPVQRITPQTTGVVTPIQGDVCDIDLGEGRFDVILAAAVLHHLRGEDEWRAAFTKFHRALLPGGSVWVADLIEQTSPRIQQMMWRRYGEYLAALKGDSYRDAVFAYVRQE